MLERRLPWVGLDLWLAVLDRRLWLTLLLLDRRLQLVQLEDRRRWWPTMLQLEDRLEDECWQMLALLERRLEKDVGVSLSLLMSRSDFRLLQVLLLRLRSGLRRNSVSGQDAFLSVRKWWSLPLRSCREYLRLALSASWGNGSR